MAQGKIQDFLTKWLGDNWRTTLSGYSNGFFVFIATLCSIPQSDLPVQLTVSWKWKVFICVGSALSAVALGSTAKDSANKKPNG